MVVSDVFFRVKWVDEVVTVVQQGVKCIFRDVDVTILRQVNQIWHNHSQKSLVPRLSTQNVNQLNAQQFRSNIPAIPDAAENYFDNQLIISIEIRPFKFHLFPDVLLHLYVFQIYLKFGFPPFFQT